MKKRWVFLFGVLIGIAVTGYAGNTITFPDEYSVGPQTDGIRFLLLLPALPGMALAGQIEQLFGDPGFRNFEVLYAGAYISGALIYGLIALGIRKLLILKYRPFSDDMIPKSTKPVN